MSDDDHECATLGAMMLVMVPKCPRERKKHIVSLVAAAAYSSLRGTAQGDLDTVKLRPLFCSREIFKGRKSYVKVEEAPSCGPARERGTCLIRTLCGGGGGGTNEGRERHTAAAAAAAAAITTNEEE